MYTQTQYNISFLPFFVTFGIFFDHSGHFLHFDWFDYFDCIDHLGLLDHFDVYEHRIVSG